MEKRNKPATDGDTLAGLTGAPALTPEQLGETCPDAASAPLSLVGESEHDAAPLVRRLAQNVIALWPEDRPPVANPPRRGRYPRGVHALRRWDRLRPGVYAYLWAGCLPENRGVVVLLLSEKKVHIYPGMWNVRGITAPLAQVDVIDGSAVPGLHREGVAQDLNLRRCPAPKGVLS